MHGNAGDDNIIMFSQWRDGWTDDGGVSGDGFSTTQEGSNDKDVMITFYCPALCPSTRERVGDIRSEYTFTGSVPQRTMHVLHVITLLVVVSTLKLLVTVQFHFHKSL